MRLRDDLHLWLTAQLRRTRRIERRGELDHYGLGPNKRPHGFHMEVLRMLRVEPPAPYCCSNCHGQVPCQGIKMEGMTCTHADLAALVYSICECARRKTPCADEDRLAPRAQNVEPCGSRHSPPIEARASGNASAPASILRARLSSREAATIPARARDDESRFGCRKNTIRDGLSRLLSYKHPCEYVDRAVATVRRQPQDSGLLPQTRIPIPGRM